MEANENIGEKDELPPESVADEQVATIESPVVEGILEKLEPEEREILAMSSYSGPLPPPEYLKGYVEVHPEAANKIFQWAEDEQNHRHYMEKESMKKSFRYNSIGLLGGIILSLFFIVGGFVLIILDKDAIGISIMAPFIISLATLLVRGRRKANEEENEDKHEKEP